MTFSLTAYDWFVLLCLMLIANLAIDAIRTVSSWVYHRLTRKRRARLFAEDFDRRSAEIEARHARAISRRATNPPHPDHSLPATDQSR